MRVSVVQCRGTPFEIGQQQGRIFAASKRGMNFRRSKVRLPAWFDMNVEERFYAKFAPGGARGNRWYRQRVRLFVGTGRSRPSRRRGGFWLVLEPMRRWFAARRWKSISTRGRVGKPFGRRTERCAWRDRVACPVATSHQHRRDLVETPNPRVHFHRLVEAVGVGGRVAAPAALADDNGLQVEVECLANAGLDAAIGRAATDDDDVAPQRVQQFRDAGSVECARSALEIDGTSPAARSHRVKPASAVPSTALGERRHAGFRDEVGRQHHHIGAIGADRPASCRSPGPGRLCRRDHPAPRHRTRGAWQRAARGPDGVSARRQTSIGDQCRTAPIDAASEFLGICNLTHETGDGVWHVKVFERGDLLRGELDGHGGERVVEMLRLGRADDRCGNDGFGQQPRQRDLRPRDTARGCDLGDLLDHLAVRVSRQRIDVAAALGLGARAVAAAPPAGEPSARERAPGYDTDALRRCRAATSHALPRDRAG